MKNARAGRHWKTWLRRVPELGTSLIAVTGLLALTACNGSKGASSVIGPNPPTHNQPASNQAPTATIGSPSDASTFTSGDTITFRGSAKDPEQGDLSGSSLVWTSNLDGQIGTGQSFKDSQLSVGTHTITLTAADSQGSTGSASVSVTVQALPRDTVMTSITSDPADQEMPAISGDTIVWEDNRNGNWDIYMFDLSTSTERRITTDPGNQENPAISGDRIVWQDDRNGNWDIYMLDLSTNTETRITTDPADQENPAISGNWLVWQDHRAGNWDVFLYDLSGDSVAARTTGPSNQQNPAISGDRLVWEDYANGNADIALYDLSTGTGRFITTDLATQISPSISGDRIVWEDFRNESPDASRSDVFLYDLSTGTEKQIGSGSAGLFLKNPVISGDLVAWNDETLKVCTGVFCTGGDTNVFMLDLSTDRLTQVTRDSKSKTPAVSRKRIVWSNGDVLLLELP